ncbi:MAG TPA: DUF1318 domain-containing protein [Hellea balneolensis]|uniref:DUF1318 domain-containing protein n=1 Tax=Hellea balneolensis TaxID=287478 RepID=A0A7C5R874_9PROT|nr:DUF1318 domain-containing protein [Hellea balneolensis]
MVFGAVPLQYVVGKSAYAQTMTAKQIVDAAKAQGLVGETIAGYLAVVNGSASAEIQAAVNEINIRRKSVYTKMAREQGVQVAEAARVVGEKLIAKAKPGEKVMLENGVWTTKS